MSAQHEIDNNTDFRKPESTKELRDNSFILTEHFDRVYTQAVIEKLGNTCHDTYFRSQFIGFEEDPDRARPDTPYILISNHSGMAFPWDAMVFVSIYNQKYAFGPRSFRTLVAPMLSETVLMNPYLIPNLWKKMGGIDATFINFETLMQQDTYNVMMYPEGVPGIGKGFNRRYQLQKFHTSYLRMAVKYRTDLHWISTINGEYINPYSYSIPAVNRLVNKIGVPFLPISLMIVGLVLQPWVFYFAFPAKLFYVRGPRIRPYEMINKPYEEITQEEFTELSVRVRAICQEHMDKAVAEYGQRAFHWGELWSAMWRNRADFPFYLPIIWPLIYNDFDRQYQKHGHPNFDIDLSWMGFLRMLWRNPIFLAYFIPILGWIPLLIKGYSGARLNANEQRRKAAQQAAAEQPDVAD